MIRKALSGILSFIIMFGVSACREIPDLHIAGTKQTIEVVNGTFNETSRIEGIQDEEIVLLLENSDYKELSAEEGEKEVIFNASFAKATVDCKEIILWDEKSGTQVGIMEDNGLYAENGDDIGGDGCYSCKVVIDTSEEKKYLFKATYNEFTSNRLELSVVAPFSDKDLNNMEEVDNIIGGWLVSEEYVGLSFDERISQTEDLLIELADRGFIIKESIAYSDESYMYSFSYSGGGTGGVLLKEWNTRMN